MKVLESADRQYEEGKAIPLSKLMIDWVSKRMSYNVLLSDAVSDCLNSQDRGRQKTILKHLHEMRGDPFKGDVVRLKPPLQKLYRKRIGNDRVLFSIRSEDIYLELMVIVAMCMSWQRDWNGINNE